MSGEKKFTWAEISSLPPPKRSRERRDEPTGAEQVTGPEQVTHSPQVTGAEQVTPTPPAGAEQVTRNADRMRPVAPVTAPAPVTHAERVTDAPQVTRAETVTATTQVTGKAQVTGAPPVALRVPFMKGDKRIPNWMFFNLFPHLGLDERVVYEELYCWTHGFNENPRVVSQKALCERLGIDDRRMARILEKLKNRGLIVQLGTQMTGSNGVRGTMFDVRLPVDGSVPTGAVQVTGAPQVTGSAPDMKEQKKERDEMPAAHAPAIDVFQIRTIAARLFEAHRNEQSFSQARLRELVREALIGQGREVDESAIEDAIRGMAT